MLTLEGYEHGTIEEKCAGLKAKRGRAKARPSNDLLNPRFFWGRW